MNNKFDAYILQVGKKGQERLQLINKFYNAASQQFLLNAGLKAGMQAIDVGCGNGEMTCWMAQQLGPSGKIYAIDASEEQLAEARQLAKSKGLTNIEFVVLSIYDLQQLNKNFDFIYCRWVLRHINDPAKGMQAMYAILKKQGIIVNEDTTTSSIFCYPEIPAFSRWLELWAGSYRVNHKDAEFGYKLLQFYEQYHLAIECIELFQPVLSTPEEKRYFGLSLDETGQNLIKDGLLTAEELPKLTQSLYDLMQQPVFIGFDRNTQIAGRKL